MTKHNLTKLKDDLYLAQVNEAYHRKQMEYFREQIKILNENMRGVA